MVYIEIPRCDTNEGCEIEGTVPSEHPGEGEGERDVGLY